MQRVRALQPVVDKTQDGAGRLVQTVLAVWQARSYPRLARSGLQVLVRASKSPQVTAFAKWLGERDIYDGAYCLSSAYATWVGEKVRVDRAIFFTPPDLAHRLIDDLVQN